jgi:hypothetical protein
MYMNEDGNISMSQREFQRYQTDLTPDHSYLLKGVQPPFPL